MNYKEYASTRNITQKKFKEVCIAVLGSFIEQLSQEQILAIDNALSDASQKLLASSENEQIMVVTPVAITERITEIVGTKPLLKNLQLYLRFVKEQLDKAKFEADTISFRAEQAFYRDVAEYQQKIFSESNQRIQQTVNVLANWEAIRTTVESVADEDPEVYNDILNLMNEFRL